METDLPIPTALRYVYYTPHAVSYAPTCNLVCLSIQAFDACQIWAKPLSDKTYAVAFYNAVSQEHKYVVLDYVLCCCNLLYT